MPVFPEVPYPTTPSRLYTPEDLAEGFAGHDPAGDVADANRAGTPTAQGDADRAGDARIAKAAAGFGAIYDTLVYRHFLAHSGAVPDLHEALAQRIHDAAIDRALAYAVPQWTTARGPSSVVGIMGGHSEPHGSHPYRLAAALARDLARAGRLVVTGGGPGVMEAANSSRPASRSTFPTRSARTQSCPGRAGLRARPGWHGPGGLQAATKAFYLADGPSGPLIFVDTHFWTIDVPVEALLRPLLAASPHGDLFGLIHLTDDVSEAMAILTSDEWSHSSAVGRALADDRCMTGYGWVEALEAYCFTAVVGLEPDEVARRLGGDPRSAQMRSFDECFWTANGPQWAQVAAVDGDVLVAEHNGWRAEENVESLSKGARVACFYRNVQAVMHFVYAVDGAVIAEFDPLLEARPTSGADPAAIGSALEGLRFGLFGAESSALTLVERLTGVRVSRVWLAGKRVAVRLPPLR